MSKIINNLITKIILLFSIIICQPIYSTEKFNIQNILIKGLKHVDINYLLKDIPIHNNLVSCMDINKTIKSLFNLGYFSNIKIFLEKKTLIIKLTERPIISNITFYGNTYISKLIILNLLKYNNIVIGEFYNDFNIKKFLYMIRQLYISFGKYNNKINIVKKITCNNQIIINISIYEGITAKIKQINIIGNYYFNFKSLVYPFISINKLNLKNSINNIEFTEQKLRQYIKMLTVFYFSNGYIKFYIEHIYTIVSKDKKYVFITIKIHEGQQYKITSLVMNCNIPSVYNNTDYIKLNIVYNIYNLKKLKNNIISLFNQYGFAKVKINYKLDINDLNKSVVVYININSGKRYYVRYIHFYGNNYTKDYVLRREILQTENSFFNKNLIKSDILKIKNLGFFKQIKVKIIYINQKNNIVDIIYKVKEYNFNKIKTNINFNISSNFNVKLNLLQNNLLGYGNKINITELKNKYHNYFEIFTMNPFLTLNKVNIKGKLFFDLSNKKKYTQNNTLNKYGVGINFNIPINCNNNLDIGIESIHNIMYYIKPQLSTIFYLNSVNIYPDINNYINSNFTISDILLLTNWTYTNIDNNNYFPSNGLLINMINKFTILNSKNNFYNIILNINKFMSFGRKKNFVLTSHINVGYLGNFNNKLTPFYNNFYTDNNNFIRGFQYNSLGKKNVYYKCYSTNTYNKCKLILSNNSIGGNIIALINTELILPLIKNYVKTARISLFIDTGNIWSKNNLLDFTDTHFRLSNGISIKIISPFGPISFSYAYPIKKYKDDKIERLQFNFNKFY
ncbi:MAG: outer membrane protein assembly factor BamA [Candidatus Lightella neohaematopini]|nr:outer membrane protein assembly factor BamA [Candidatus Lightella neohaematopini]MCV2528945.1 outer membrane protein assembly factor BamA [Candidatus Lightella neohaematopini]